MTRVRLPLPAPVFARREARAKTATSKLKAKTGATPSYDLASQASSLLRNGLCLAPPVENKPDEREEQRRSLPGEVVAGGDTKPGFRTVPRCRAVTAGWSEGEHLLRPAVAPRVAGDSSRRRLGAGGRRASARSKRATPRQANLGAPAFHAAGEIARREARREDRHAVAPRIAGGGGPALGRSELRLGACC